MEEPLKRLIAELAAAHKLEARASQELLDVKPVNSLSPSLQAAAEASRTLDAIILRPANFIRLSLAVDPKCEV